MRRSYLLLLPFLVVYTSCAKNPSLLEIERISSMNFNGDSFKVLQLTDLHFTYSTNIKRESSFITSTVNYANPDLIVVTGDSLLNATKGIVNELFSMFDSWKIPYYFLFGNHELQGFYSESFLIEKIGSASYCLNQKAGSTSKSGHTDNVFSIKKDEKTIFQIYTLDTHNSTNIGGTYYYDSLKQDQIDWYELEARKAKNENGGVVVPSIGFMHIPLWEIVDAYIDDPKGILGEIHESATYTKISELVNKMGGPLPFCPGGKYAPFFRSAKEFGMKGIFFGHDHSNDWVGKYQEVAIGYGVKSDRQLYFSTSNQGNEMIGGALYNIRSDASFSIKHFFMDYESHDVLEENEVSLQ